MAGVLKRQSAATGPADARQSDRQSASGRIDTLSGLVDAFVMRTVETLCQVEASVPRERQPADMRRRIDEVLARLDALEALLAEARHGVRES